MTSVLSSEMVLRVDQLGRARTPRERRKLLLEEFDRSGMSGAAFARQFGINYHTFAAWIHKRRLGKAGFKPQAISLVEAVIEPSRESSAVLGSSVRVQLPGGASVEVADKGQAELVAILIQNLGGRPC